MTHHPPKNSERIQRIEVVIAIYVPLLQALGLDVVARSCLENY